MYVDNSVSFQREAKACSSKNKIILKSGLSSALAVFRGGEASWGEWEEKPREVKFYYRARYSGSSEVSCCRNSSHDD